MVVMIKTKTSLVLLLLLLTVGSLETVDSSDGICRSLVEPHGYICEEHKVITRDGCILGVQRIPTGRSGGGETIGARTPVLLIHGVLSVATHNTFLDKHPLQNKLMLSDSCWLTMALMFGWATYEGRAPAGGHTSLSPNDREYWNWSVDELVAYDFAETVQFVYSQTGQKLHYVAHSLGTFLALAAFSRNVGVTMVRSAALLCPIAYLGQLPSPLVRLLAEAFVDEVTYWLGIREISLGEQPLSTLVYKICSRIDCTKLVDVLTGPNCCLNKSSAVLAALQPTSTKNLVHLAQLVRRGNVAMFDYGHEGNNKLYGQPMPPEYDITSIPNNLPLLLSYGGKDLIADFEDVQTLLYKLSDHDPDKLVSLFIEEYSHVDFISGLNSKQVVYNPVMAFFRLN